MTNQTDYTIPQPSNGKQLTKWLRQGKYPLNYLWKQRAFCWKFYLRSYIGFPKTRVWLEQLSQLKYFRYYMQRQAALPCKLQRPYLANCMSATEALQGLGYHYQFMEQQSERFIQTMYSAKPYLLATIHGKNESQYQLVIMSKDQFTREGELTIMLLTEDQFPLACLTFSLIEYQQQPTLFIAGLQAGQGADSRQLIQQATKNCYGLFPKRIVTDAALQFAAYFNLPQILAVSNRTHIYNNWRYRKRAKEMHSDYDSFWLTVGATSNQRQLFELPPQIERKPLEAIASKKRSEYRQRYALLDQLKADIMQQLHAIS